MTVSKNHTVGTLGRLMNFVALVERFYLSALRIILLLLASGLVIGALWLGVSGLYQVSRSTASVVQEPATVTATEIADIPVHVVDKNGSNTKSNSLQAEQNFYRDFVTRYFELYQKKFAQFRKVDDPVVDRASFDTLYVKSADRLESIGRGDLNFEEDKAELNLLLSKMREVAALPQTVNRLMRYRMTNKIQKSKIVRGTKTEQYCSYFGYYINQCISYDTREVPYQRTVVETYLPPGVMTPGDLFQAYQDRHFDLLASRRRDNVSKAEAARESIIAGNAEGASRLLRGVMLVGGFLAVMFLFLVIAIERHQRKLVNALDEAGLLNHQVRPEA